MAVQYKDRVRESTSTTGTGNITLSGAPTGFQSFNTAYGTSVQFDYCIVSATGTDWEVGEGHLSASTTLVRDTVHDSTNAGALVNFSAGAKDVRGIIAGASLETGVGNQTTFIRTLLDDASASAARTTLELAYASAAEQETGTATDRVVAPGTQHRHPSAAKCWGCVVVSAGTPSIQTSYNLTSITDTALGQLTVTIATDMTGPYPVTVSCSNNNTTSYNFAYITSQGVGAFQLNAMGAGDSAAPADVDPTQYQFAAFGDQ